MENGKYVIAPKVENGELRTGNGSEVLQGEQSVPARVVEPVEPVTVNEPAKKIILVIFGTRTLIRR